VAVRRCEICMSCWRRKHRIRHSTALMTTTLFCALCTVRMSCWRRNLSFHRLIVSPTILPILYLFWCSMNLHYVSIFTVFQFHHLTLSSL